VRCWAATCISAASAIPAVGINDYIAEWYISDIANQAID
jgi:hypothetical protein